MHEKRSRSLSHSLSHRSSPKYSRLQSTLLWLFIHSSIFYFSVWALSCFCVMIVCFSSLFRSLGFVCFINESWVFDWAKEIHVAITAPKIQIKLFDWFFFVLLQNRHNLFERRFGASSDRVTLMGTIGGNYHSPCVCVCLCVCSSHKTNSSQWPINLNTQFTILYIAWWYLMTTHIFFKIGDIYSRRACVSTANLFRMWARRCRFTHSPLLFSTSNLFVSFTLFSRQN